ncbi:MAG: bifunctional diguanylate cyclase/phosphodiesterase [Proteobacteria bacterium]|nr:bifunctional diguanylate cyclase/phosphodiesterase [Pseudomonadota bacterium]
MKLVDCNKSFAGLGTGDGKPILDNPAVVSVVDAFLSSDDDVADHDWTDGDPIAGREYTIRLARLRMVLSEAPACLITLLDRTAERSAEKSLRLEMYNDSLTGLPNRAGFGDRLEGLLAQAEPGSAAVLIVDLARFSRINESIGGVVGDELLITVARRLLSAVRAGDILARTGGNEFGVFIRIQDGPEEALAVAQRLSAVLIPPCRLSDLEIRVGSAIGCAVFEEGCDGDELIRRAQFALKRAKASGEAELYQPLAFDLARAQFTLETSLRRAIEADRLTLAFQPVIQLSTGRVCGFEALARWREDGVEIPPGTFIPVAEESGLILPLGRWAVKEALATLSRWDSAYGGRADVRVAVNVSAIQMVRDDVPAMIAEALNASGIGADRLMLELTESAIVADPARATEAMAAIREIGATIALDDFGTGYSNLAYLQQLPIDVLKIDQSFVTGMLGDRDKIAIVRAVLSLAQALGINTTAEGVETQELTQTLAALGCTNAQGYFYAPPLEADAAFDYWRRSRSSAT